MQSLMGMPVGIKVSEIKSGKILVFMPNFKPLFSQPFPSAGKESNLLAIDVYQMEGLN